MTVQVTHSRLRSLGHWVLILVPPAPRRGQAHENPTDSLRHGHVVPMGAPAKPRWPRARGAQHQSWGDPNMIPGYITCMGYLVRIECIATTAFPSARPNCSKSSARPATNRRNAMRRAEANAEWESLHRNYDCSICIMLYMHM